MKGKFFYGWVVVAAFCLITAIPMVFTSNYWSFYQVPICTTLGCSYVEFNLSSTAATVAGMIFSMFFAEKFAAGKTKLFMMIFGVANGLAWVLIGVCNSIWPIVALYFVSGFCAIGGFTVAVNIVVPQWFIDRRGLAISLAFMGQGLGGAIFSPVMSSMIASMGWRTAIMISGAICIISYTLIAGLLIRIRPQDMGLEPYRQVKKGEEAEQSQAAPLWEGVSKKTALRSVSFWALAGVMICCGFIAAGVITQLPTYLIELNVEYALVMSVYAAVMVIALVLMGPMFDKFGVMAGVLIEAVLLVAAFVMILMTSQNATFAFAGAALFALGSAVTSLAPPLLTSAIFGPKDYAGIYGFANTFFMLGCMVGPLGTAAIRSALGSYNPAWMLCIGVAIALFALSAVAIISGKKFRADKIEE